MAEETGIPLKLDTAEFDATLAEYLKVSSRGYATAINTKLYYIALRAIAFTPRADKLKIGKSLSPLIYEFGEAGQRSLRMVTRYDYFGRSAAVPVAALLINAERGKKGKPGYYGAKMRRAIKNFIARRQRSVSFLKAGWIPAVKTLAPLADKKQAPEMGEKPTTAGHPKGRAVAASAGSEMAGLIANSVGHSGPHGAKRWAALKRYGQPALQRAINEESASMVEYMAGKAREAARQLNIGTRG